MDVGAFSAVLVTVPRVWRGVAVIFVIAFLIFPLPGGSMRIMARPSACEWRRTDVPCVVPAAPFLVWLRLLMRAYPFDTHA